MASTPRITAVIAVYDVEEYLPAFLESLDWQTCSDSELELIFVNDASPDDSESLIEQWSAGKENVRVLRNLVNGGAAEARRRGYAAAEGEWVTSIDPDDILDPDYFANVLSLMDECAGQDVAMYTSRVMPFNDSNGQPSDSHPLGYKYKNGDRLVSLSEAPSTIQLGATAFLKTGVLRDAGVEFDARIRPTFEDGALIARYLLEFQDPTVALVSSAIYYYRKRSSGGSLVQSGWKQKAKYFDQLYYGYLPVLRHAEKKFGKAPDWLQFTVLYDISWYFTEDIKLQGATDVLHHDPELAEQFVNLLEEVFSYFTWQNILKFNVRGLPWNIRETLLIRFFEDRFGGARLTSWGKKEDSCSFSLVTRVDPTGKVEILVDGRKVVPEMKVVSRHYFGKLLSYESYFSCPAESLVVSYEGKNLIPVVSIGKAQKIVISDSHTINGKRALSRGRNRLDRLKAAVQVSALAADTPKPAAWIKTLTAGLRRKEAKVRRKIKPAYVSAFQKLADSEPVVSKYQNAWLIMDRPNSANDNGEHFYRWVKNHHPEKNCFFVLSKEAEAWERLQDEGFSLLDYGSLENKLAYFNAEVVVSSDAVADVMYHAKRSTYGDPQIPFVFLQHGVTRNDISAWLNPKKIDLIIATTKDEAEYFSSPSGPYLFSPEQVALTGFARFDRLVELRESNVANDKDSARTISFMPTWRSNLKKAVDAAATPEQAAQIFRESEFAAAWEAVFTNPNIERAAKQGDIAISFILHPNFDEFMEFFKLPGFVNVVSIQHVDFQKLLVDTALFVTDHSSAAFDAAVAGSEVCYYQFDWDEFYSGAHTQRPGYFLEARDGFGPTFFDSDGFIEFLEDWIANKPQVELKYHRRVEALRSTLDGHASERTYAAIEEMLAKK